MADHDLARIQAGVLTGRGALSRLAQRYAATRAWRPDRQVRLEPAGDRRPWARTRTPSTLAPRGAASARRTSSPREQLLARADRNRVLRRVGREHVQRRAPADAQAVALADREQVRARVLARAPLRARPRSAPGARRGHRDARERPAGACRPGSRGPASRACAPPAARSLGELAHAAACALAKRKAQARERLA